jgi:hypothetical protein
METIKTGNYVKCIHKYLNTGDHLTLNKQYRVIGTRLHRNYKTLQSFIIKDNNKKTRIYKIYNSQFEKVENTLFTYDNKVSIIIPINATDNQIVYDTTLPYIPEIGTNITLNYNEFEGLVVNYIDYDYLNSTTVIIIRGCTEKTTRQQCSSRDEINEPCGHCKYMENLYNKLPNEGILSKEYLIKNQE